MRAPVSRRGFVGREGIVHVLVNGVAVVEGGTHTGARPGRALRKG